MAWFVHPNQQYQEIEDNTSNDDDSRGPFSIEMLKIAIVNDVFGPRDYYYYETFDDWKLGKNCSSLRTLFDRAEPVQVDDLEDSTVEDVSVDHIHEDDETDDRPVMKIGASSIGSYIYDKQDWLEENFNFTNEEHK